MSESCRVDDCENPATYTTKRLCKRHYDRLRKSGTTADPKPKPELTRFLERVSIPAGAGCWQWNGPINRNDGTGYGSFNALDRNKVYAHRWSYEYYVGPIPSGLQIDHLCRNTLCVNPGHLEPVTPRVNMRRSEAPAAYRAKQAECSYGHAFDETNAYIKPNGCRDCRECRRRRDAERRPRRRKSTNLEETPT